MSPIRILKAIEVCGAATSRERRCYCTWLASGLFHFDVQALEFRRPMHRCNCWHQYCICCSTVIGAKMNDCTSTKFSDTSTAQALPMMTPTARASSSYSSTVNNGNNATCDALSRSSTVQTQQATAALMLLTLTLLATAKMAPTPALAATSLPSSMSPLTTMPPISTITLAPTIVSMAYEAMAPFLDEIKIDLVPHTW